MESRRNTLQIMPCLFATAGVLLILLSWSNLSLSYAANHRIYDGRLLQHSTTAAQSDIEALLQFKAQLTRDPKGALSSWQNEDENAPCSWYGITCSSSTGGGRVVKIELQNGSLEGDISLPALLQPLDKLTLLDLSGNRLYFANLSISSSCASLESLVLSNNLIHGEIPGSILSTCASIRVLDLSHNNLTGAIPQSIFTDCGSLRLMDLSHNHLRGNLPYGISQCSSLQELHLSSNHLSGQLPLDSLLRSKCADAPAGIPCALLQVLDLSSNNLSGPIYDPFFRECGRLISIDLSSNAFAGEIPASIESCSWLEYLNLSNNRIAGGIPASLGNLSSIKFLDLSNNSLTGSIPGELGNACPTLVKVDLSTNNLSGTIPPSFTSCGLLQHLHLAYNNLSGSFPARTLVHLRSLESLHLTVNGFTGPLPTEVMDLSTLKVLDLGSNKLSGLIPSQLCSPSSSVLEKLMLPNNRFWGEIPVYALANCSKLKVLDLSFNHLQGEIPAEIGRLANLESLSMWYNEISGEIPKEVGLLSKLKVLVLNNNFLSGQIPAELSNCTEMQWLLLSNNQLTGSVPAFLGSMRQLTMLEMGNNSLSGPIPLEIANASNFLWVDLNSNFLSGSIPPGIGRHANGPVDRLHGQVFAFIRNQGSGCRGLGTLLEFAGITPEALAPTPLMTSCNSSRLYAGDLLNDDPDLSSIQVLDLSYNRLEGSIPDDMGYLTALMMLSLGHNLLQGTIPASFAHLRTIGVLDLSYNRLDGGLWALANCSFLVQIDVSYNNFSGPIPSTGQLSTASAAGFEHNSGLCAAPLPPCGSSSSSDQNTSQRCINGGAAAGVCISHSRFMLLPWANSIVMGILIAVALVCMIIVWRIMLRAKRRQKDTDMLLNNLQLGSCHEDGKWDIAGEKEPLRINVATFEMPLRKLTFAQLIEATNGFSPESLIGVGGFGEVYKAELKDGSTVAIKKLLQFSYQGDREFTAEMETLGMIKHRNLVPLLGYCKVGEERLLVYEFMHCGSLEDRLHGDGAAAQEKLGWDVRKRIAIGVARGLCFLHHGCTPHIIHRDVKSSNVLLDRNLEARLSDFGMARLISAVDTHLSVSTLAGTPGYVPPEYYQSFKCTFEGDMYSFGVVLLELLTGKRPTDKEFFEDTNLVGWVRQLVSEGRPTAALDPWLQAGDSRHQHPEMLQYLHIACDCVQDAPSRRPTMRQVLSLLNALNR